MAESKIKPLRIDYKVIEESTTDDGVLYTIYNISDTVSLYVKAPKNCIAIKAYEDNNSMLRILQYNTGGFTPLSSQDVTVIMGIKRY